MSFIFSWLKDFLYYLKNSIKEILLGFLLVIFSMSGFVTAAITKSILEWNGILITLTAVIVELTGMTLSYFLFTTFFLEKGEEIEQKSKKK